MGSGLKYIYLISFLLISAILIASSEKAFVNLESEQNLNEQKYWQLFEKGNIDSLLYIDSLLQINYQKEKDTVSFLSLYHSTCNYLIYHQGFSSLTLHLANYIDYSIKYNDLKNLASAYYLTATFFDFGDMNKDLAVQYYFKALEISKDRNDHEQIIIILSRLGMMYQTDESQLSEKYLKQAIELAKQKGFETHLLKAYLILAETYRKNLIHYDTCQYYNLKAYQKAKEIGNDIFVANTYEQKALDMIAFAYRDSVLTYFNKALELYLKQNDVHHIKQCYNNLGEYYEAIHKPTIALKYFKQIQQLGNSNYKDLYKIASVEHRLGLFEDASRHFILYEKLKYKEQEKIDARKYTSLELKFILENVEKENELLLLSKEERAKAEIRRQKIIRNFLIVISLFSLLILFLLNRNFQNKKRADKILRDADANKLRFLANISHEIRTPLTILVSPLQRLASEKEKAINKEHLSLMFKNANKLQKFVNQLLDLSSDSVKEKSVEKKIQDFGDLFSITIAMFQSQAKDKQINFIFESNPGKLIFSFDYEKMEAILTNLLDNAFKFTPSGGTILVAYSKQNDDLILKVKDSGIGIPKKEQSEIFKRFYQSEKNTNGHFDGVGIGLSLVKEYVSLHDGSIEVNSNEGNGSEFIVQIPIKEQNEEAIKERIELFPNTTGQNQDVNSKSKKIKQQCILIVEDNKDLRDYISFLFNEQYKILQTSNGKDGIKTALSENPDIIISDVMMPGINGFELTHKIKSNVATSHIPVLLLTAKNQGKDKIEGFESGADDYIVKPFNEKELILKVANIIQTRQKQKEVFKKKITVIPREVEFNSLDEQFILKISEIIEKNLSNAEFTVEQLCENMSMSRRSLYRKLKSLTDMNPSSFIRTYRLKKASQLISSKKVSVSEAAFQTGFENLSYFSKCFKEEFNKLPSEYS